MCYSNSYDENGPVDPKALNELVQAMTRKLNGEISTEKMEFLISRISITKEG